MKSRFAIINEIIDSDDGFVRFHFSAHTKGALLYIASCYVVRTTIKAKLHFAAWLYSLSKNFQNTPVSGIIEETGVLLWKAGEKMHGEKQSLWI